MITVDQPINALAKQVQWHWLALYGDNKCVVMFGGLHIEMAAMTGVLTEAGVASSKMADPFLSAQCHKTHHMYENYSMLSLYA